MIHQPVPIMLSDLNLTDSPMMPYGYTHGNLILGPQNFVYIEDPLIELSHCSDAIIRQKDFLYNGSNFI